MATAFDDARREHRDSETRPHPTFSSLRVRKRELLSLQRSRWEDGHPAGPRDLLARWPTDPDSDPDAASLLLEDYLQRRRRGEEVSLVEYESRFPEQKPAIERAIAQETILRSIGARSDDIGFSLRLPDVGDEVFGFRLRHPLGQGAFARVFLAEQADLAGRPVVLKVSNLEGDEPQTLAQLLHTNIVPIYSLHDDERSGLRAVCMPYLGGASLSAVLGKLWTDSPQPISGEQFLRALESVAAPKPETVALAKKRASALQRAAAPPIGETQEQGAECPAALLSDLSYERATAGIVAQLADGLHHAHERGILHRDIKASNILISADAQPLLLDFNLARAQDEDAAHATIGGTVAYMSPEHLRALVGRTPSLIRQVDRRSDIYSLGMVLAEMLTGRRPFEQSGSYSVLPVQIEAMAVERSKSVPSVKRERPDISWSIESIARKCLEPDPNRRYQRADQLADDLRRILEDRPLKYAPELSRVEQARKFIRRHPRLASSSTVGGIAALVLLGVGTALAGVRNQLADTRARDHVRAHDAGVQRALCLVNTRLDLRDNLRDGITACERTLAIFGEPEDTAWDQREDWRRIAPDERRRLAEDRRELLMSLADARVRLAGELPEEVAQALTLLDRAESIPGLLPSRALWFDRARYHSLRGETERALAAGRRAQDTPATTARDHYLLATSLVRTGGLEANKAAIAELNQALERNPRHYWSLIQRGICRLERGELVEAAADFGQCIGIWPEFAWGYFNRGCVLDRTGNKLAAVADFTAAIERDPSLAPAYMNRGLTRLELKQSAPALLDFDRAGALGAGDPSISAGRGIALEGLGRHDEADRAFRDCFARAGPLAASTRSRLAWSYGFAISARDPDRAQAAFNDALLLDPKSSQALYGRAMLAMSRDRPADAIRDFESALKADPSRIEARRYLAVTLARQGDWQRATEEINRCLERDSRSAPTLYAAACVVARAFDKRASPDLSSQAIDLLDRAFSEGADPTKAKLDPDLASLRRLPRFQLLFKEAGGHAIDSSPATATILPSSVR
jgi:serine/threonine protein kinase/tetratricopeptide (TPR) repeat protein